MSMDAIPIGVLFAATIIIVVIAIEAGYRLGNAARRRSEREKEPPVSAIAAAILGLVAFIMAFTFGIVSDRYDARKALVRDEAERDSYRLYAVRFSAEAGPRQGGRAFQAVRGPPPGRGPGARTRHDEQDIVRVDTDPARNCGTWRSSMPART